MQPKKLIHRDTGMKSVTDPISEGYRILMSTQILAIDPGTRESGYVVWDGAKVLESGVIGNESMLAAIPRHLATGVDILAIEQIGHYGLGMPAGKEVFDTCRWIGRYTQIWIDRCISECPEKRDNTYCILRPSIKTYLCGTPRAKDANVRQAIHDRLGKPGTKKQPGITYGVTSHAIQALALAVYVADMLESGVDLPRAA